MQKIFLEKRGKAKKGFNMPKKAGHLTKDGRIWQNNLMDVDSTASIKTVKKIK